MTVHELRTWPEPFALTWEGVKTAEFRADDRDFAEGDRLRLREYDPARDAYSGRWIEADVTCCTRGPFVPRGFVMLSLGRVRAVPLEAAFAAKDGPA
jgi:hypothetical protein